MPKRKCSEIDKNFGRRLKQYRVSCGLTQEQVSAVLNINRTTYTKYETGVSEPSQELLGRIVAMFGTDYNTILGGTKAESKSAVGETIIRMSELNNAEKRLLSGYRAFDDEEKKKFNDAFDEILAERNRRISESSNK